MENEYERVHAVGFDSLRAYRQLSRSARRTLDLCVEHADKEGIAHLSRAGITRALGLGMGTVDRAFRELAQEGFAGQAALGLVVVNLDRVWVGLRLRGDKAALVEKFQKHKEGYAPTLANKQAAGRESWRKRQAARGVTDGLVEKKNGQGGFEPPY